MAFCANCGATVAEGAGFCPGCGKSVGAAAAQPPATAQTNMSAAPPAAAAPAQAGASGLTSNVAAALAYILGFITGIIFLVIEPYKNDRFVRFHAMQSIFYSVACIVFGIAWSILVSILMSFTIWMGAILTPVGLLLSLGFFVFWLFLMYQAYSNKEFRIPFIGDLAAKQIG